MKKINMFVLDWITVPVFCLLFPLGITAGVAIMAFVTAVFCYLNYRDSRKTVTLFLEDINLMGAAVLGILLNNLLYIRFIYADRDRVSTMVVIIFLALVFITFIMIISMCAKEIGRRKRRRIIDRLAAPEPAGTHGDDDIDDEDDDDGDDDDDPGFYDDDEDDRYETERRVLERISRMSDNDMNGPSEDEGEEEKPAAEDETRGPKFKVIKKGRNPRP